MGLGPVQPLPGGIYAKGLKNWPLASLYISAMLLPYYQREVLEAGVDEAGRGCMAGPVVAAAVILPEGFAHPLLNDSKKLSAAQRNLLRHKIEAEALAWQVAMVGPAAIDEVNILQATYNAMHAAIAGLQVQPECLLIDGNRFRPYPGIAHHCFVQGDGRFAAIAAASILAKTHRDALMVALHDAYPDYQWHQNKGYGTAVHLEAMDRLGLSPHHRKSFTLRRRQLQLFG